MGENAMKLNQLENLHLERAQTLMDGVNSITRHASTRAGTPEARQESIDLLRAVCEAWDDHDAMAVYIESIKHHIAVPSLGMSLADAELWLHGLQHKQAFLEGVIEAVDSAAPEPSEADDEVAAEIGEDVVTTCPTCGEDVLPSVDMDLLATLIAEVRSEITRLSSAIERACCAIDVEWNDRSSLPPVTSQTRGGMRVMGEIRIPDGVVPQQSDVTPPQPPQPPPQVQRPMATFQVVDPTCPVCMSQARLALEKHWIATQGDTVSTLELALQHDAVPKNVTPQVMQMHFDDHTSMADHGLA